MALYPSIDLLMAAASELTGKHPLTIITVPAILRAARKAQVPPTDLQPFGSKQERLVLDAFKVNNTKKPYIAVWGRPPQLVNNDYPGSTLQRLRTQDILGRSILRDNFEQTTVSHSPAVTARTRRSQFALRDNAGANLTATQPMVSKAALAAWLGRRVPFEHTSDLTAWFDENYPLSGTDLHLFYTDGLPAAMIAIDHPFDEQPAADDVISELLGVSAAQAVQVTPTPTGAVQGEKPDDEGLSWTREVCEFPLADADARAISKHVLNDLRARKIVLPDEERLIMRCVTALLVGHVILQGPPGTGKTTLARALARGFSCDLIESTATSDWSPYHVVGGLRPSASGGLAPAYGWITEAARACAEIVRTSVNAEEGEQQPILPLHQTQAKVIKPEDNDYQATWLLIDEFNRADIDKAIGSLYTLLSSCDPGHLVSTPLDLWFESRVDNRQLWVPARFRIIGAMNDLDTSFVNPISQGLARRFQFVTVGVPTARATETNPVTTEVETAFEGAHMWLDRTYGSVLAIRQLERIRSYLSAQVEAVQVVIDGLRAPTANIAGWPVGTAQVVDVLRTVLLWTSADPDSDAMQALDYAVADRLVPQMSGIEDPQYDSFMELFNGLHLNGASQALEHLFNPHTQR